MSVTASLTEGFLQTLISELDSDDIEGIILGGSFARGEATPYSDVDIACFVKEGVEPGSKRLFYREGRLVSVGYKSVTGVRADIARPRTAIWVVPGLADCRSLLDKGGAVEALLREVRAFSWEPLQQAADRYASFEMMLATEMVHKVAGEIKKGDDLAISYATSKLFAWLTGAVAVQRGVLVKTDSTYYRQVQESVGTGSEWTRLHNVAAGAIGPGPVSLWEQGMAVLALYSQTVAVLAHVMEPKHLEVAEQAARLAKECS